MISDRVECESWTAGSWLLGLDETGIGNWAGSLYIAGVCFPQQYSFDTLAAKGLRDSKKTTEATRFAMIEQIKQDAVWWQCLSATAAEVDFYGSYYLNFKLAADIATACPIKPIIVLIDGNKPIDINGTPSLCMSKADGLVYTVAAASIIAKVESDNEMKRLDAQFPCYGWISNKGYGTKLHREAITKYGTTKHHRKTYCKTA